MVGPLGVVEGRLRGGAFDVLELSSGSAEDLADARGLSSCAIADGFTPKFWPG